MLKFEEAWRYTSPGAISQGVASDFSEAIGKLAKGRQYVLEEFKRHFAAVSGATSTRSSEASWAATDLANYMSSAEENAPMFIEAFYDGCESLRAESYPAPDIAFMNGVLGKHNENYRIEDDRLIYNGGAHVTVVKDIPVSIDEQARTLIEKSLGEGDRLMTEGRHRQAVQEMLWLLETVTTVFEGLGEGEDAIKGKYFNKIIAKLKEKNQGTALNQVIDWITKLHGWLSAPAGGGIRHGQHLKDGVATSNNESLLYYNLIKSYISYLLSEYDRLKTSDELPF